MSLNNKGKVRRPMNREVIKITKLILITLFFIFLLWDKLELIKKLEIIFYVITIYYLLFYSKKSIVDTNIIFTRSIIVILTSILIVYTYMLSFKLKPLNEVFTIKYGLLWLTLGLTGVIHSLDIKRINDSAEKGLPTLIIERQNDLERLKEELTNSLVYIVGLNGGYGEGKSLLIEHLKKDLKDEYYFIEIDVLSSNEEDIQIILINEIDNILRENGIFSRYSNKLRNFFRHDNFLNSLYNQLFFEDTIFINMIKGIKEEVRKLDKKIVIIYEDIDRIDNTKVIKRILGISEKLAYENIKVVYQYSQSELEKKFNMDKKFANSNELIEGYLDKYIEKNVNLTELSFLRLLKFKVDYNKETLSEHINIIRDHGYYMKQRYTLNEEVSLDISLPFNEYNTTMRRVKRFLNDLNSKLSSTKNEELDEDYIKIIFLYYFLEHFVPEQHNKIKIYKELHEIFTIKSENNNYTINNLQNLKSDIIHKLFRDESNIYIRENRFNIWFLTALGYKPLAPIEKIKENEDIKSRSTYIMKREKINDNNEKINYRFKNLHVAGVKKYTNYEYFAKDMLEKVLSKDKNNWLDEYNKLVNHVTEQDKTIFYMGINPTISLFKAFNVYDANQEEWIKLFEFIKIKREKNKEVEKFLSQLTSELFEAFAYLNLDDIKVNIEVGKIIKDAEVVGSLNNDEYFHLFLSRYYRNWNSFVYKIPLELNSDIDFFTTEHIDLSKDEHAENNIWGRNYVVKLLEDHLEKVMKFKNIEAIKILDAEVEVDLNYEVTKKLIEIINYENVYRRENPFKINFSHKEKEEIKKLKELYKNNDISSFKEKAKKYYVNNKVTKGIIQSILNETESKK